MYAAIFVSIVSRYRIIGIKSPLYAIMDTNRKKILIIGSGNRVQNTILPAMFHLRKKYQLVGICSRSEKILVLPNGVPIQTIIDLSVIEFRSVELIIVAITTKNIPEVLEKLSKHQIGHVILFLDTPVFHLRHLWAMKYLSLFKNVFISEDYISLPNYTVVKDIIRAGKIGQLRHIYLFHSGYRHHALAILKGLTSSTYISHISSKRINDEVLENTIVLAHGIKATVFEPRDYGVGRFLIVGEAGCISDYSLNAKDTININYIFKNGNYFGLEVCKDQKREYILKSCLKPRIMSRVADQSLMNCLKIEGLIRLYKNIFEKDSTFEYSVVDGLYDNIAFRLVINCGYFFDFLLPLRNNSFLYFLLSIASKVFSLAQRKGNRK